MKTTIVQPKDVKNGFYKLAGFCILFLNKIRHDIQGYVRPRPFPVTDVHKAIAYDKDVLARHTEILKDYTKRSQPFNRATILELGPGADLGVALLALQEGAQKYIGLDVNPLAQKAPKAFYQTLVDQEELDPELFNEVDRALQGTSEKLVYQVDTAFDPRVFSDEGINLVISHAAFEHFDDVEETIKRTSEVLVPGGVFIADIDLQTHTRWIREADPLNIYRYSSFMWKLFSFLGSPNRVRPVQYKQILEKHGFTNIQLIPRIVLDQSYTETVRPSLHKDFQDDPDLSILDFYLVATKH